MGHWTPSIKLHCITEILDSSRAESHHPTPRPQPPHVKGMRGQARSLPCGLAGAAVSRVTRLPMPLSPAWQSLHNTVSRVNCLSGYARINPCPAGRMLEHVEGFDGWHAPRPSPNQRQRRKLSVEGIRTGVLHSRVKLDWDGYNMKK